MQTLFFQIKSSKSTRFLFSQLLTIFCEYKTPVETGVIQNKDAYEKVVLNILFNNFSNTF